MVSAPAIRRRYLLVQIHAAFRLRGVPVYCSDFRCSHGVAMNADRWADDLRLSDLEPRFVCQARGKRGAILRNGSEPAMMGCAVSTRLYGHTVLRNRRHRQAETLLHASIEPDLSDVGKGLTIAAGRLTLVEPQLGLACYREFLYGSEVLVRRVPLGSFAVIMGCCEPAILENERVDHG
jgi:hypothetical protein